MCSYIYKLFSSAKPNKTNYVILRFLPKLFKSAYSYLLRIIPRQCSGIMYNLFNFPQHYCNYISFLNRCMGLRDLKIKQAVQKSLN